MARLDGKFIRGIVGPVTYKTHGDKQIVQAKSKKAQIDMTVATYDAAFIFGRASTLAAYIRVATDPIIDFYDGKMIFRLTGECNQILQQASVDKDKVFDFSQDYFNRLNGFEFNQESPVKTYLFAQPQVTLTEQNVTIDLPEMQIPGDLKFPANARYCTVAFSVALFDLNNEQYKSHEIQSFEIELQPKSFTLPPQQLIFEAAPGCLCVISLALYYFEKSFAGKKMVNSKSFSPSAILKAAFCPGDPVKKTDWAQMTFNEKEETQETKEKETSRKVIECKTIVIRTFPFKDYFCTK